MSLQRALVRIQTAFPDTRLVDPGEVIEWEGLNWKLEPVDAAEWGIWSASVRDDERVEKDRKDHGPNDWRDVPAGDTPTSLAARRKEEADSV